MLNWINSCLTVCCQGAVSAPLLSLKCSCRSSSGQGKIQLSCWGWAGAVSVSLSIKTGALHWPGKRWTNPGKNNSSKTIKCKDKNDASGRSWAQTHADGQHICRTPEGAPVSSSSRGILSGHFAREGMGLAGSWIWFQVLLTLDEMKSCLWMWLDLWRVLQPP